MDGLSTVAAGPTEPRSRRILGWVAGFVLGLAVVGPVLRPGALLNLDLVVTDSIPVPPSIWGLGPELPRRLPFFLPLAWLSTLIDGAFLVKVLMVAATAVAFRGMHRLCQDAAPAAALAAAIVYAAGPFLATRLLTGHLGTALATAILPWSLPTLLHPAKDLRRTLLWSAALGCAGINGGIFAFAATAVGTAADRGRRAGPVFAAWLVGQLPWLIPGLVVMAGQDVDPSGAEAFDTQVPGVPGLLRLATGQGFWLPDFEVGAGDLMAPLVGAFLVVLAIRGSRRLPPELGPRSMALAAVGLVIAIASAVPVIDQWYVDLASTALGSALREGHRLLPLFLVWLAPAAAMGASSWGRGREVLPAALLGASIALAGSALFGFGGRLEPVRLPSEWEQARAAISADPGIVVTLPWSQYLRPAVIDGHLVHNPAPFFLGGDVLLPSGRGDAGIPNEFADPRVPSVRAAVGDLVGGGGPQQLSRLGVRWLLAIEPVSTEEARALDDPALEEVVRGETARLYRVGDALSRAVDSEGTPVPVQDIVGPLARVSEETPITWHRPGASGWMRGWSAGQVTGDGLLEFGPGGHILWYWPAGVTLLAQLATGISVIAVVVRGRRGRPVVDHPKPTKPPGGTGP